MALLSRFTLPTAIGYFLLSASFNVARDMFTKDYDADLDHHMYFGQRLLFGELIWTREIYDKFPVIQYLFAVPAYFGSVRVWFAMSAVMLIASAVAVFVAAASLIPVPQESAKLKKKRLYSLLCVAFYLYLSTTIPPSLAHINSFTTSCAVISLCAAVMSHHAWVRMRLTRRVALHLSSATFASCAMAIRPFLGAPLLLLVTWLEVRHALVTSETSHRTAPPISLNEFANACWNAIPSLIRWTTLTVIALFATNFLPYLATSAVDAMLNGIMHNSQKLNPQSPLYILIEELTSIIYPSNWYYLFVLVTIFFIIARFVWERQWWNFKLAQGTRDGKHSSLVPNNAMLDLTLGVIAPLAALEAIILARHWWGHYWQMFVPIGLLHFMVFVGLTARRWPDLFDCSSRVIRVVGTGAIAIGLLVGVNANQEAHHPQQAKFDEIVGFLNLRRTSGLPTDFLDIGDMYPHWQLRESRHGFPHAQNIQHIVLDWYASLHRMAHIDFPYTREELCQQVIVRGPSVVFMTFSYMFGCLLTKDSNYLLIQNSRELIIFVRTPIGQLPQAPTS